MFWRRRKPEPQPKDCFEGPMPPPEYPFSDYRWTHPNWRGEIDRVNEKIYPLWYDPGKIP